jgi:hypothetical protein
MGTSKNFPSPDTPPWKPALAILGRLGIPVERQAQEIWRSASAERGGRLVDEFAAPALATACALAASSRSPLAAVRAYEGYLARHQAVGFATELARRALARAVAANQGSQGFAAELFAEATSYYASRDLPSFVGARGRIKRPVDAITLKAKLKARARDVVRSTGAVSSQPELWARYASSAIGALRESR